MRKVLACLLISSVVLFAGKAFADQLPAMNGEVIPLETPTGLRFGLWGTKLEYPAPTLFIFASSRENSLGDPYYRQCGNALAEKGFLCVSVDLPGHGKDHQEGEPGGLSTWRVRSDQGRDFVAPFTEHVRGVLDHLIEAGFSDASRIAACGTSRGGFMAIHAAAADERIRATAAFAPVTELTTLREFHGVRNPEHVSSLSLNAYAEKLVGRSLWLVIGDRDERVGTDDTIAFARLVTRQSIEKSKPADLTLLVKPEPKGHTTPAGSPEEAAKWIMERLK